MFVFVILIRMDIIKDKRDRGTYNKDQMFVKIPISVFFC